MPKKKKTNGKFLQGKDPIDSYYEENVKSRKKSKSDAGAKVLVVFLTALCVCVGIFACATFLGDVDISFNMKLPSLGNRVMDDTIRIAGVDITGLTKDEAIAAVSAEVGDAFSTDAMIITVLDKTLELSPAVTGAKLDVELL